MSDLKTQFETAVADSKNLPERPDNQTMLKMYGLYKQATSGDASGTRPRIYRHGGPRQMGCLERSQGNFGRRCDETVRVTGRRSERLRKLARRMAAIRHRVCPAMSSASISTTSRPTRIWRGHSCRRSLNEMVSVIEPVPVLFAGLLEAHRQLGPAEVLPKMQWMWKNVLRKAAVLDVPLNAPVFLPSILFLRFAFLVELHADERLRLVGALFDAVWVRGCISRSRRSLRKFPPKSSSTAPADHSGVSSPNAKRSCESRRIKRSPMASSACPRWLSGTELVLGLRRSDVPAALSRCDDPIDLRNGHPSISLRSSATRNQTVVASLSAGGFFAGFLPPASSSSKLRSMCPAIFPLNAFNNSPSLTSSRISESVTCI